MMHSYMLTKAGSSLTFWPKRLFSKKDRKFRKGFMNVPSVIVKRWWLEHSLQFQLELYWLTHLSLLNINLRSPHHQSRPLGHRIRIWPEGKTRSLEGKRHQSSLLCSSTTSEERISHEFSKVSSIETLASSLAIWSKNGCQSEAPAKYLVTQKWHSSKKAKM